MEVEVPDFLLNYKMQLANGMARSGFKVEIDWGRPIIIIVEGDEEEIKEEFNRLVLHYWDKKNRKQAKKDRRRDKKRKVKKHD